MEKIINSYETLYVIDPDLTEDATKALVEKFTSLIADNGTVNEVNEWRKRRLAYPINDMPEGYYVVVTFKSAPEFPSELERLYNIDENVMRSMVLRLEYEAVAKAVAAPAEEAAAEEVAEAPVAEEAPAADAE